MASIDEPGLSLIPFEDFEDKETLLLEVAKIVILGKLYYVCYERNAWGMTPVRGDYTDAFQLDLAKAKDTIENSMRVRGSTWTIQEIPACIFIGSKWSLILSEINNDVELSVHQYSSASKPDLHNIAECFVQSEKGSFIRRFIVKTIPFELFDGVYRSFKSESGGGYYRLSWYGGDPKKYDTRALLKIRRAHKESLKKYGRIK